jgi:hypothetical protein
LEAAKQQAEALLVKGQAEASVIEQQNAAEVAGLRTAVLGFGSASQYAQFQVISRLGPAVAEIFASDESEFARLVASYLTNPDSGKSNSDAATRTADAPAVPVTPASTAKSN